MRPVDVDDHKAGGADGFDDRNRVLDRLRPVAGLTRTAAGLGRIRDRAAHPHPPSRQAAVDENDAKRRTVIAVAVLAAILVPLLVIAGIILQGPGVMAIHDQLKLPTRVHACGRNFQGPGPARPLGAVRSDGVEPVLVDTGPLAPCPEGFCIGISCATVVYVRVGDDAYVAYELLGGP
jgi:hypothetical protein